MAEEWQLINSPASEGGEIPADDAAAIKLVASNIDAIRRVAEAGSGGQPLTEIDGNATRIRIRRATTAQWEASDVPLEDGEYGYDTDTRAVKVGDGTSLWPDLPPLVDTSQVAALAAQAETAAAAAEEQAAAAEEQAAAAVAQKDAAAASAEEAAALVEEAQAAAEDAASQVPVLAAQVRQLAGVPVKRLAPTASGDYTLKNGADYNAADPTTATDLFCEVWVDNGNVPNVIIPKDWNTTAAEDGRPANAWCVVRNNHTAALNIKAAAGTSVAVTGLGMTTGQFVGTSTDNLPAQDIFADVSVPAGVNRRLVVMAAELNADQASSATNQHIVNLAVSNNATGLTKAVPDTGPNTYYGASPRLNGVGWYCSLPDSADAATTHRLTFSLPDKVEAFRWVAFSFARASTVTMQGQSATASQTGRSITLVGVANGASCALLAQRSGGAHPATNITGPTGFATPINQRTGSRIARDISAAATYATNTSAGNLTYSATFGEAQEGVEMGAVISPAAGASGVTILGATGGTVSLPAGKEALVGQLSDGATAKVVVMP